MKYIDLEDDVKKVIDDLKIEKTIANLDIFIAYHTKMVEKVKEVIIQEIKDL